MSKKPLVWDRLKNMLCPKCNKAIGAISALSGTTGYACSNDRCDFRIGSVAFNRVIEELYKPKSKQRFPSEEENQAALSAM